MIWFIIFVIITAGWGWARWFTHHSGIDSPLLLPMCLAIAFSTGGLSLVMLWLGLLQLPITATSTTVLYMLIMLPGWWLTRHNLLPAFNHDRLHNTTALKWAALVFLFAVGAAVFFNAVQWPFYRDDTLGIYVPFAQEIAATHALAPINESRQLYELYPQHLSMNYAYVFMATGWENPYPARLLAALLSLACLPATFLLTRELFNTTAAWIAVVLLAATPDFSSWASSGYVDLPMAFFYTLGALFLWKLPQNNQLTHAICAGLLFGLAAWTKNAALLGTIIFFMYLVYRLMRRQLNLKVILIACTVLGVIAAPWYLRNLWLSGMVTPDTVWTDNAQQTIREFFVLIALPQNYGLSGWVMLGGVFWGIGQLIRQTPWAQAALFSLLWAVPYFITWLLFASYDPRFILLFLPFLAALGSAAMTKLWQATQHRRMPYSAAMLVVLGILTIHTVWNSIEYKRALLNDPLMSHEMKLDVVRNRD